MTIRVWPVALLSILLSACAASPRKPLATAVAAPIATTAAAAAAKKPDAQYDQTAVLDKRAREMGYRVENRGGTRSYCHSAAPTGSHISREACLNAEGMIRAARAADDDQDRLSQQQMQSCSGCAGGGPLH
jgi:hypothetical protein